LKLHVLSDLHLEREAFAAPAADADVVVLAGDVARGTRGIEWARGWAGGAPVVYVAGNHEFYGHALPELLDDLRRAAGGSPVRVLERDEVVVAGVRFLGCTLWSDFDFGGPEHRAEAMRICGRVVNDYRHIAHAGRALQPRDTRAVHLDSREWLAERLATPHDGPTVVVTHHAPLIRTRPRQPLLRALGGAFASDLTGLMGGERAATWIYGHTHRAADLDVNGTRVVSNPRGYPDQPVDGFDPGRVIALG
jgi:predicted phosphodiesterase